MIRKFATFHARGLGTWRFKMIATGLACSILSISQNAEANPKPDAAMAQPQAERLSYIFKQTGEAIPYRLWVPSSYDGTSAVPLVVALHGGGQDSDYVMEETQITRIAEEYGMIVVAPLGYNRFGGYGSSFPIVTTHSAAAFAMEILVPAAKDAALQGAGQQTPSKDVDEMETLVPAAIDDHVEMPSSLLQPPETLQVSEQDVMNVLDLVRENYRIDPSRIYLTGNSMGGMGTQHLAAKYPEIWAAIAPAGLPIAVWSYPFWRLRDHDIAVLYVHGTLDNLSAPYWSQQLCKSAVEEGIEARLLVIEGGTHISAWDQALPQIFSFFGRHRREDGASIGNFSHCVIGE